MLIRFLAGVLDARSLGANASQGTPDHAFEFRDRSAEGVHSLMPAKTLPLLLLGACAATAQLPAAEQPQLAQLAQPYARQLRAVGVTRVISPGKGGMVRLETAYGSVYMPYPAAAEPVAFELDIGREGVHARAATFDRVSDERMLAALVPEALRVVVANNRFGATRADPWH